jgi:hypothetical protein
LTEYGLRLNLQSRAGLPARLAERQERSMAIYQRGHQEDRLREAAPKSINEEVRFLLKMLGEPDPPA